MTDELDRRDGSKPGLANICNGFEIVVPPEVFAAARDGMGAFFEPISQIDRNVAARDFLDIAKATKRAAIIERYVSLFDKKMLEIGSGFGTNIAVWSRHFRIDGYGVEPSSTGFDDGYTASRVLLAANGLNPDRIIDAAAETLPFGDESFDIVYSANVLEHTRDPERVLGECLRVLRRGGTMHMEIPNHLSYFEGHYMLLQPPLIHRRMLPAWVSLFGRDPAFARTIQTQINPCWCKRVLAKLSATYPLDVISFGEELFLERLATPFEFEASAVSGKLGTLLHRLQQLNYRNWIGRTIVALRGFYPLYVTVRRR